MAKLYYRYGAMNSGKSSALMQVAHNYNENGKKVVIIKSSIDTKGDDCLESRIGLKRKVDLLIDKDEYLEPYYDEWEKDNVPFTEAGDIEVNGIAYQIKFEKATFTNEKSIANLGK